MTLHLACAADDGYAQHVAAMLHSVWTHSGGLDVHVHFLAGDDLGDAARARLHALAADAGARLDFLDPPPEAAALPQVDRFTPAIWHRFFLPELLPGLPRVLYLDADTIACSSLAPLWRTDLGDHWLGAVTNVFQPNHRGRPKRLGLPSRDVYFNSGVLLMNLDAMRRDDTTGALLRLVAERGDEFEWPDQDALNIALGKRRLYLHPRWNATNALRRDWSKGTYPRRERLHALLRPGIRHFEGPGANKPWDPQCTERQRGRYRKHLAATGESSAASA